jgi:hypothetical protein
MALYEKPVRLLMKDMAKEFALEPGQHFTKKQAIDWFSRKYSKVKVGTISAHLIKLSTNATSRHHYNARPGEDDVFYQLDGGRYRLYDSTTDPVPIYAPRGDSGTGTLEAGDDEESQPPGSAEFAYEEDLKNYLARNLSVLEAGLTLYEEEGIVGIEFPVGGRFIDILARDSIGNLVVIELKVSRGYDRVVGQLMRYMAWIATNQAEAGQKVRGMIVARSISADLKLACSLVTSIELFEYELSLTLKRIAVNADV